MTFGMTGPCFIFSLRSTIVPAYLARLRRALRDGGHVILGTFALNGPDKCSGLPVCRYDARSLAATLGTDYALVQTLEHSHPTPGGTMQLFTFAVFARAINRVRKRYKRKGMTCELAAFVPIRSRRRYS